jgi:hypothetical protein
MPVITLFADIRSSECYTIRKGVIVINKTSNSNLLIILLILTFLLNEYYSLLS